MKPWVRKTLVVLLIALAIVGVGYYWLLLESHVPDDARYDLDLAAVRVAANSLPGDKAHTIEVEEVAVFEAPAGGVVAGDGWDTLELPVYSYRLVFPGSTIVIDTALDRAIGGDALASFDAEAYARMAAAMKEASSIVITHEHMDHIGGLTSHPELPTVLPKARLTQAQIANPDRSKPASFPQGALDGYEPISYDQPLALAPGVALIGAAGHSPGSQIVYVQTAGGEELLFIGDVAWQMRNIDVQRERPRLVTQFMLQEDRKAVFGQLVALKRIRDSEPAVRIVPGHDGEAVGALVGAGLLKPRFGLSNETHTEITEASK